VPILLRVDCALVKYRVMDIAVKALEATYGTKFSYGSIANVICNY
jgi:hypothetical protein